MQRQEETLAESRLPPAEQLLVVRTQEILPLAILNAPIGYAVTADPTWGCLLEPTENELRNDMPNLEFSILGAKSTSSVHYIGLPAGGRMGQAKRSLLVGIAWPVEHSKTRRHIILG